MPPPGRCQSSWQLPLPGLELLLDRVLVGALARAETRELEDFEHVDQIEAGAERQNAESSQHQRPARVEVAVMVGVGNEAQRKRKRGQRQRPAVEVEHGSSLREADVR